jgi:hypothetical protein
MGNELDEIPSATTFHVIVDEDCKPGTIVFYNYGRIFMSPDFKERLYREGRVELANVGEGK